MTEPSTDTELLTEHFGYPPVSLLDEIINSINIISERGLTSIETGLLKAPATSLGFGKRASASSNTKSKRKRKAAPPPLDDEPPLTQEEIEDRANAEIASGTHQLETLLCTSIDRNFDKFEIYVMRNILCVHPEDRDWMRLGHYEGLNFENLPPKALLPLSGPKIQPRTEQDGDAMDIDTQQQEEEEEQHSDIPTLASVSRLRRRLQASQKLNTMLLAEQARTTALLTELRAIVGQPQHGTKNAPVAPTTPAEPQSPPPPPPPLAFLRDKGNLAQADATMPLTTTTAFALSQLQALRALGTSLGTVMPELRTVFGDSAAARSENDGDNGRRTWRKERVEYVEGAARKHLESVRGLELGAKGEVRDGEWQGEGKRIGSVEVGALEGVVGILGETAASAEGADEDTGDGEE